MDAQYPFTNFFINSSVAGDQKHPAAIALKNGTFFATWHEYDSATGQVSTTRAQLFNADGTKLGPEIDLSVLLGETPYGPSMAVLNDGRVVLAAQTASNDGDISAWILNEDATLNTPKIQVNSFLASQQSDPSVAALNDGGFAVTYKQNTFVSTYDVLMRSFDASGNPVSSEFLPTLSDTKIEYKPTLISLGDRYLLVYLDRETNAHDSVQQVRARILNADGALTTADSAVSPVGQALNPTAAAFRNGGFIVAWEMRFAGGNYIQAEIRTKDNTSSTGEFFLVGGSEAGIDHVAPNVVTLPDGSIAFSYVRVGGEGAVSLQVEIYRFDEWGELPRDENGFVIAETITVAQDVLYQNPFAVNIDYETKLTVLADGRLLASWTATEDGSGTGIGGSIIDTRIAAVSLAGDDSNDQFIGTTFDDTLSGASGHDKLWGAGGNDTLTGGSGADYLDGGADIDTVSFADAKAGVTASLEDAALNTGDAAGDIYVSIENLTGSDFADKLFGDANGNILIGGKGNDTLDGNAGVDTLRGGQGDDTYVIDSPDDVVEENDGEGNDTIVTAFNYALGGDSLIENLTAAPGTANINLTGNGLDNRLTGNAGSNILIAKDGNDVLDGGEGADRMDGGAGNDTYYVDSNGDTVIDELGTDEVIASIDYAIGEDIEHLTAAVGLANLTLTGNTGANRITGNDGANVLIGGAGSDTLNGGGGIDTASYMTATQGVVASLKNPAANEGDAAGDVYTSIENLTGSSKADRLTGDDAVNVLDGGDGDDVLDGGRGADRMIGGQGDDTYVIDEDGDVVEETTGQGTDTVVSHIDYVLANGLSIETIKAAAGASPLRLTGNADANKVIGNDGNNLLDGGDGDDVLEGGGGTDILIGGKGDDTYIISDALDSILDVSGHDSVIASLDHTLAEGIEDLTAVQGSAAVTLGGNALRNTITGNDRDNLVEGGGGDDMLDGMEGVNTAVFSGLRADYTITWNADGTINIADKQIGRDGNDLLRNFRYAKFSDQIVDLAAPMTVPNLSIFAANAILDEGSNGGWTEFTFTVTRDSSVGESRASWALAGTGTNPATADDFQVTTGDVVFADGETSKTISVWVKADTVNEQSESFRVTLTGTNNANVVVGSATGAIMNDDAPVNTGPANLRLSTGGLTGSISEANAPGAVVATMIADDDGGSAGLRYAMDADGTFEIDALTGQIRVKQDASLDFDKGQRAYSLVVKVRDLDGAGQEMSKTVTLNLTDANEKASQIDFSDAPALKVGMSGVGSAVSVASAVDPDSVESGFAKNLYRFDNGQTTTDDGLFIINATTGQIRTNRAVTEADVGTKSFTVVAYDATNTTLSTSQTHAVVIQAADNAAPANLQLAGGGLTTLVLEGKQAGDVVATVTATDDGGAADLRYGLTSDTFEIDAISGQIRLKTGKSLDYEGVKSYTLTVSATDQKGAGLSTTQTIVINVGDVNERASRIDFSNGQALKAGATAADPDAPSSGFATNLYRFDNGQTTSADGLFVINAATGQITTSRALTAADAGLKTVNVVAYDATNSTLSTVQGHTILISEAGDGAPTNLRLTTGEKAIVAESAGPGALVATIIADDDGLAGDLRYAMADNDTFEIDALSGQIRLKGNASLNFEDHASYTVTVKVRDQKGLGQETTKDVVIDVSDVNEKATDIAFTQAQTLKVGVSGTGAAVVLATASDLDTDPNFTKNLYRFDNGKTVSEDGLFVINATTGQITTTRAVTASDAGTKTINVVTYDESNPVLATTKAHNVSIVWDGNVAPSDIHLVTIGIGEPKTAGDIVGRIAASDDGGTAGLRYSIADNDTFEIDAVTGKLKVKQGATIDYETHTSYTVVVTVTDIDGTGLSTTQEVKIRVIDTREDVRGDAGANNLVGGVGADVIYGMGGNDQLTGGAGDDAFAFDTRLNRRGNVDKILDFTVGEDTVWLDNAVFKKLGALGSAAEPAELSKAFFVVGTKARDRNDYIIYNKGKGVLMYDADGSGSGKAVEFAKIGKGLALTYKDFFVI